MPDTLLNSYPDYYRRGDPSFPAFFPGLAAYGKSMVISITTAFLSVPQVPSAFFQSDPSSPALLLGVSETILRLCWFLNLQQPIENLEENTLRVLMMIERTVEYTMRHTLQLHLCGGSRSCQHGTAQLLSASSHEIGVRQRPALAGRSSSTPSRLDAVCSGADG
jgi:hypothetical protein